MFIGFKVENKADAATVTWNEFANSLATATRAGYFEHNVSPIVNWCKDSNIPEWIWVQKMIVEEQTIFPVTEWVEVIAYHSLHSSNFLRHVKTKYINIIGIRSLLSVFFHVQN